MTLDPTHHARRGSDVEDAHAGFRHMSREQFLQAGEEVLSFIADYYAAMGFFADAPARGPSTPPPASTSAPADTLIPDRLTPGVIASVRSLSKPGELLGVLPINAPTEPEPWRALSSDVQNLIMPGVTHWQHPGFFGYFPANASPPAVLGELLSAGLGVQGMLWATSPACTELEIRVLDWLARLAGLPERFWNQREPSGGFLPGGSVILTTASEAVLVALVAARKRAIDRFGTNNPAANVQPGLMVYTSSQAHSSVIKAAMVAGLCAGPVPDASEENLIGPVGRGAQQSGVRLIPVDDSGAMRTDLLRAAVERDIHAGRIPVLICATAGTTASMGFDDIRAAGQIARTHNAWLHVDSAMAGVASICPEMRAEIWGDARCEGLNLADSVCFNPHKWLLTNFDCDAFYVADRKALTSALALAPSYLKNAASDSGAVVDYRDWQIALGRRFRALKLWFVMRSYGSTGLQTFIREHVRLAQLFENLLRSDHRFELAAERGLSLVCFRLRPSEGQSAERTDAMNARLLEAINATGRHLLTHAVLPAGAAPARYVLRLAIGGSATREEHVRAVWDDLRRCAGTIGTL